MKYIRKGRKPAKLAKFERENAGTPQVAMYDGLTSDVRRALAVAMLKDQGHLCAYTMRRIGQSEDFAADCHIEHMFSREARPDLQLDYRNMILCAPGRDKPRCEWGARRKDNAVVNEGNFVFPLRADCETRLRYRLDGSVCAASDDDAAAKSTVALLNLNHRELVSERIAALGAFGLGETAAKPLRGRAVEALGRTIAQRHADGRLAPFCIAIQQAAFSEADKAVRRAARMRGAR